MPCARFLAFRFAPLGMRDLWGCYDTEGGVPAPYTSKYMVNS